MITADSIFEFQRIPIADLRVTEYQERYPDRLQHYIEKMLAYPDDAPGFILVKRMSDCASTYEILDGHHRFVAHIMTGRDTALCIVIEEPNVPGTDDQGNREALRSVLPAEVGVDVGRSGVRDLPEESARREAAIQGLLNEWAPTGYIPGAHRTYIKANYPKLFDALLAFEQAH